MTPDPGVLLHVGQGPVPFAEYLGRVLVHLVAVATLGTVTWGLLRVVSADAASPSDDADGHDDRP